MENMVQGMENFRDYLPVYLISIHPGGHAIYLILLILILGGLSCLPIVSVQVSVSGQGIIRPLQEKVLIIPVTSGIIDEVFAKEGDRIQKADPLLKIRSAESNENLISLYTELREAEIHTRDLEGLTSIPLQIPLGQKYSGKYEEYLDRIAYLELLHTKSMRELSRNEGLFRAGLISEKEYDDLVFAEEKSSKELETFKSQSASNWQNQYFGQLCSLRELKAEIRGTEEKIRMTTIYAPATGNLVEFKGILQGSAVQAGSVIGVLSPESGLIGEFFVSSADIAYIKNEQKVHLHLDAFNAREWGVLPGRIYEISSDFLLLDSRPVYRIKCHLEKSQLQLKNGYTGEIKKGMTFQARCLVTRRTLFQLLSDKADNWLNPAQHRMDITVLP
ncbi:HlyD family secretion protein [Bacteroidota bacterium]